MSTIQFRSIDSPVGLLTLAGRDGRLMHLRMVDQTYEPRRDGWTSDDAAFPAAVEQLESYFAGQLFDFDLELDLVGTTFQRAVWQALLTIPYGETRSYGEIAAQIGTVRELVSRNLSRLQAEGMIAIEGRSLIILDPAALDAEVMSAD